VATVVTNVEVNDYDEFKSMFDEDPAGRIEAGATGHRISRAVDNPNDVFIRTDFPSVEQAQAFRQKLLDSGVLNRAGNKVKAGPVVAEEAESITY
jgi:hypothetical protein